MAERNFLNSILLILGVFFIFLVKESSLSQFSLQITALLFLIFFFSGFFKKIKALSVFFPSEKVDAFILNIIVLLLVTSTGGLSSSLFFLIYFLLFGVSLLVSPTASLVLALSLIIFFLPQTSISNLEGLIPLFSLPLIAPLAVFLGRTYLAREKLKTKLAFKEEDTLIWLTTTFKGHLEKVLEIIENFPPGNLDEKEKKALKEIEKGVKRLEVLGQKLKKDIEDS